MVHLKELCIATFTLYKLLAELPIARSQCETKPVLGAEDSAGLLVDKLCDVAGIFVSHVGSDG